jgi:hypothetical protein
VLRSNHQPFVAFRAATRYAADMAVDCPNKKAGARPAFRHEVR